jgi:hypothetical protein
MKFIHRIIELLHSIDGSLKVLITQPQFDTDLENLVTAQAGYITAAQALIAAQAAQIAALQAGQTPADLTNEDNTVLAAEQTLATALAAIPSTAAPSAPGVIAALKSPPGTTVVGTATPSVPAGSGTQVTPSPH